MRAKSGVLAVTILARELQWDQKRIRLELKILQRKAWNECKRRRKEVNNKYCVVLVFDNTVDVWMILMYRLVRRRNSFEYYTVRNIKLVFDSVQCWYGMLTCKCDFLWSCCSTLEKLLVISSVHEGKISV